MNANAASPRGTAELTWSVLESHPRWNTSMWNLQSPSPNRLWPFAAASSWATPRMQYTCSSTLSLARACERWSCHGSRTRCTEVVRVALELVDVCWCGFVVQQWCQASASWRHAHAGTRHCRLAALHLAGSEQFRRPRTSSTVDAVHVLTRTALRFRSRLYHNYDVVNTLSTLDDAVLADTPSPVVTCTRWDTPVRYRRVSHLAGRGHMQWPRAGLH